MKVQLFVVILFSSLGLIGPLKSQSTEFGISGGVSIYSGDLSPQEFGVYMEELNSTFGFFGRFNTGRYLSFRLGLNFGKLTGEDSNMEGREGRNYVYRSDIFELALTTELNLFSIGSNDGLEVTPFIYGGGALYSFNPEFLLDNNWIEVQPLGTEGQGLPGYENPYKLNGFAIPFGGGIKFAIRNNIVIGFEFGGRKTFSDYLDDITSAQVNYLDVLEGNGELAATISNPLVKDPESGNVDYQRGGGFDDWYFFGLVTVSFTISEGKIIGGGRGIGCPTNF